MVEAGVYKFVYICGNSSSNKIVRACRIRIGKEWRVEGWRETLVGIRKVLCEVGVPLFPPPMLVWCFAM